MRRIESMVACERPSYGSDWPGVGVACGRVVVRRCRLGWRWILLDLDVLVDAGSAETWLEAHHKAEKARRGYRARVVAAFKKNRLTPNVPRL